MLLVHGCQEKLDQLFVSPGKKHDLNCKFYINSLCPRVHCKARFFEASPIFKHLSNMIQETSENIEKICEGFPLSK